MKHTSLLSVTWMAKVPWFKNLAIQDNYRKDSLKLTDWLGM